MSALAVGKRVYRYLIGRLSFRAVFIAVFGAAMLVLFLYHGRPGHFYRYFPDLARSLGPKKAAMYAYVYGHLVAFVVLFVLPALTIPLVFRERVQDWGIRITGAGREFGIVVVLFLLFLPVILYFSTTAGFQSKYPKLKIIRDSGSLFFLYQGAYLIKWFAWEFFFRGYLLFGFKTEVGENAILFSTLPFVIVHMGKPEGEIFGAIAAGIILCRLSLRGGSIFPGVLLHWMVAGTMDFLNCTFWK